MVAGRVAVGGIFIGQPQLVAGLVCLLAFIALWVFVTRTETGIALQATAQDREAAAVMGIPTDRMLALGWAIGLGCVAVAGTMLANFYYVFPDVGVNFALLAFVTVALGGFGSILGSLAAGLLIGLVESLGGLLIDPSYKTLIVFLLYLIVVILRPGGLYGRA
jgi:branched-chain amino acid transport system permease protein